MSPEETKPKPGEAYFTVIRKGLKGNKEALAAVDALEADFAEAARDRTAMIAELKAQQTET